MMKNLLLLMSFIALVALGTGCKSTETVDTGEKFGIFSEEENIKVEELGKQYGLDLLKGINEKDYQLFTEHLSAEAKTKFPEDKFIKHCEQHVQQLGKQHEATYLGFLRHGPLVRIYVWKVEFEKNPPANHPEAKSVVYDKLFTVMIVKIDDKYQILAFGF